MCDSDNMDPVGVYTGSDGLTSTYTQPSVVTSLPSVRTPSSSNCVTYNSADVYAQAASYYSGSSVPATTTNTASGSGSTASHTGSVSGTTKATGTTSKATGTTKSTSTSTSSTSNAAMRMAGPQGAVVAGMGVAPVMAIAVSVLAGFGAIVAGL